MTPEEERAVQGIASSLASAQKRAEDWEHRAFDALAKYQAILGALEESVSVQKRALEAMEQMRSERDRALDALAAIGRGPGLPPYGTSPKYTDAMKLAEELADRRTEKEASS